jgi:hypothetical protein
MSFLRIFSTFYLVSKMILLVFVVIIEFALSNPLDALTLGANVTVDFDQFQNLHTENLIQSVKKLAAIGDSYSAGIGAGNRLGRILQAVVPGSG